MILLTLFFISLLTGTNGFHTMGGLATQKRSRRKSAIIARNKIGDCARSIFRGPKSDKTGKKSRRSRTKTDIGGIVLSIEYEIVHPVYGVIPPPDLLLPSVESSTPPSSPDDCATPHLTDHESDYTKWSDEDLMRHLDDDLSLMFRDSPEETAARVGSPVPPSFEDLLACHESLDDFFKSDLHCFERI